jgi:hypothetical protein
MARPLCSHLFRTSLFVWLVAGAAQAAAADPPPFTRVRSSSPVITALIGKATELSATFRREVDAINQTNGLVYVEDGWCRHAVSACLLGSVDGAGGPYRILRVRVYRRRPERDLMAAIGHELQHAIEVLSDPHITDADGFVAFFQREGPHFADTFETEAGILAGLAVLHELSAHK